MGPIPTTAMAIRTVSLGMDDLFTLEATLGLDSMNWMFCIVFSM